MMRKDIIARIGGYDENVRCPTDWSLWLKLAEIAKIKYLRGEVYYVWRKHPANLSHTSQRIWLQNCMNIIAKAIKRRYGIEFKG